MGVKANTVIFDIQHVRGTHDSVADLSEIDHRRYLALWALGTEVGYELLPEAYNLDHPETLKRKLNIRKTPRMLLHTVQKLAHCGLIQCPSIANLRRIAIVGLAVRCTTRTIEPYRLVDPVWFGSVCKDKKNEAAPPRSSEKKKVSEKKYNWDGYVLGKIRLSWKHHFGSAEHPRFDWIRDRCRDLDVAWWWVFKYAQGHNAKKPREYVSWILRPPDDPEHPEKTERPWPDESATSYVKCEGDAIDEANRKAGG
jgi:hypothetical protein